MIPLANRTDAELIALCKANNELGFSGLYTRYARRVYNSIHRIVAHTAEAEDLLQETFLTLFKEAEKLSEVAHLEGWIKRVAINKSISHLRKKKIEWTELPLQEPEAEEAYDPTDDERFEARIEEVKKSIERLPQGYRTIVYLYVFENIPQEEIARMLSLSHTTVRTQYHRAKKKILAALNEKAYAQ
ncbi:ECF RNA polymerase sigma factor SigE [compost metagenome]